MKLNVRLFGALAERVGTGEVVVDVAGEATVAELVAALRRRVPDAAGIVDRSQVAVNLEIATADREVDDGDEIAVFPPVAGGADDVRVLVDVRDGGLDVDQVLSAVASDADGADRGLGSVWTWWWRTRW